jgi:hypothetical protein
MKNVEVNLNNPYVVKTIDSFAGKRIKNHVVRYMFAFILLFVSICLTQGQIESKKVFIHYMGWFSDSSTRNNKESLRYWKFGTAGNPLIGHYSSKSWSLLTYHILLSWAAGIDGIIINVKDLYDDQSMKELISTIKKIRGIDSINFKYEFGISYDDQGFDLSYPFDTAFRKFSYLKDSILPYMTNYIRYNGRPAVFVFDYPQKFLKALDCKGVLDTLFKTNTPILIWNSIDDQEDSKKYVDAFYPWVQPGGIGWKKNGLNWGSEFLDYYYQRVNDINTVNKYIFTCGGVWAGFDDRKNTSWGGNRFIDRKNGMVYDNTWSYVLSYNKPLPLKWVVIETWNDWNEGTEIEPSKEEGYKYLLLTIKNINAFKGIDIDGSIIKFEAAQKIYNASLLLENNLCDPKVYDPVLKQAISEFLQKNFNSSLNIAGSIIDHK